MEAVGPAEVFQWTSQGRLQTPAADVKVGKPKKTPENAVGLFACATLNVSQKMKRITAAAPECTLLTMLDGVGCRSPVVMAGGIAEG